MRNARPGAGLRIERQKGVPPVNARVGQALAIASRVSATPRGADGRYLPRHGAYQVDSAWVRGKLPRWARRLRERRRLSHALGRGFVSWSHAPAALRAAIDSAIRAEVFAEALFSGFWTHGPEAVPKRYDTAAENLRRQLSDLGLEPVPLKPEKSLDEIKAEHEARRGDNT